MTKSETWKDVVGFEGLYKISDKGNVYSVARKDSIGRKSGGRMLKPAYNKGGYLTVGLCKSGKVKREYIHRLVAETFILNPKGFLEINHKDENKSNNESSNLEWCTREYNVNYGTRTEKTSKKVRAVNVETGDVLTFNSTHEAGRNGYPYGNVSAACRGSYKAKTGKLIGDGHLYKGFRWSYEQ